MNIEPQWRGPELKKLRDEEVAKAEALQGKMLALIDTKNNKIMTEYLAKKEHTQLAYLDKVQQETRLAVGKQSILQHIITFLNQL